MICFDPRESASDRTASQSSERCDTVAGRALNFAPRRGHEKALKSWHGGAVPIPPGTCDCAERSSASDMISLNWRDMFIPRAVLATQPYIIAIYRSGSSHTLAPRAEFSTSSIPVRKVSADKVVYGVFALSLRQSSVKGKSKG